MEVWKGESNGREGESGCDEVTAGPRRRGGCRRVGLEQRVLHAAAPHHKVPANGTPQTRGERGGGRRDGGNGGPTRWGERGAAVGRCAGRWTGVRGLGCCGAGTHLCAPVKSTAPRARRLSTSKQGREGWGESMGRARVDGGCAWAGVRRNAGRARGGELRSPTGCAAATERCLAAAG